MRTTPAYLVQDYDENDKKVLQLVGAIYSLTYKGWFLTEEQYTRMSDPSIVSASQSVPSDKNMIFIDDLIDVWKIYGNTFSKKDAIKQLGARWSPSDRSWRIDKHKIDRSELERLLS